ncbi:prevent-host-death protein [Solwaraspora sp. WMMD792]|uniref:prevent-host-death protein n=1 Tax=Solwaraspora sp. WMMD792 TaxID=3016099 RepID=UPI002417AE69|nr:prevent-host-death protein [Solwaraspora sp. WMMD792]MDG4769191.1 prevent-host-death protein [Solwaraspora sp. WMMD792]
MTAGPIRPGQELSISAARDQLADIFPADLAEAAERAEDAADVAAAREALARIEAGEEPVSLAALRAELGL